MSVGHDGTILISGGSSCLGEQIGARPGRGRCAVAVVAGVGRAAASRGQHGLGTGGRLERGQPARTGGATRRCCCIVSVACARMRPAASRRNS